MYIFKFIMQAIVVSVLVFVFVGVCKIEGFKETEKKCPCTLKDRQIIVDCLNKTKNGNCDFEQVMFNHDEYLTKTEQRISATCVGEEKNYVTEGELNETLIKEDIQKMNTTEDVKLQLSTAYDDCAEDKKASDDVVADVLLCTTKKAIQICKE